MAEFKDMSLGPRVNALNAKIMKLEKEIAGLRQDVRTILSLLRSERLTTSQEPVEDE